MRYLLPLALRVGSLLTGFALAPHAHTGEVLYRFAVVDATVGKRLPATSLQIVADDDEPELKISGSIASATSAELLKEIRVSINAGDGFAPRKVNVLSQGLKTKGVNEFSLEPKPTRFTKQYLDSGVRRLEAGDIDRGLAFFEQAFNDPERKGTQPLDDYEVILRYNYARGLQQACLVLYYGTCVDARRRLEEILAEMGGSVALRIYSSNRIQPKQVQTALADLGARGLQDRYRVAIEHSTAGRYLDAKAVLDGLKQDISKNRAAFVATGLDRARLDADLSYFNARLGQEK